MTRQDIAITIDGREHRVAPGTPLSIALLNAGVNWFRTSVQGEPRGPVCGMGVCFECRVTVNGEQHERACLTMCAPGMRVETGSAAGA